MGEAQKMMKSMKDSNQQILEMNAAYVLKNSQKYLKMNNSKVEENKRNQMTDTSELVLPKVPQNFNYVNDNVRGQLKRALLNFNPTIHLNNLKLLAKTDNDLRHDINNLNNLIEHDLEEVLDDHYYRKKYKEKIDEKILKLEKEKEKERENNENSVQNKSQQPLISKEVIEKKSTTVRPNFVEQPSISDKPYLKHKSKNNKNKDTKKGRKLKDKTVDNLESLKECVNKIVDGIGQEHIDKYINEMRNSDDLTFDRQMMKYFPGFKETEDILKNVQSQKHNKNTDQELKETKTNANLSNEEMIKFIKDTKTKLLLSIINNQAKAEK